MRPAPRLYLLIVVSPLAVLVSGCMLLNFWIDPTNTFRDQRLTTRTYALPALLAELERPTHSESEIDVILLGTSRTHWGFDTRQKPKVVNLGIDGSTERMSDNLLVGLLQTSTRPHVYLVDTMGGRENRNEAIEGRSLRHLVSGGTTKLALRKIAERIRKRSAPNNDSFTEKSLPPIPPHEKKERFQKIVEYLRKTLPIQPSTRAAIEQRVQQLEELAVSHNALVVYYDGPHSPISRSDPLILNALLERSRLWRQVMAERNEAQFRSPHNNSADVDQPKVTVVYASYVTPTEWGEPVAPEVWKMANWRDPLHFKPTTGKWLLDRLTAFAEESQQSTTSP